MKKLLLINYWLMIGSWCLFLNDAVLPAIIVSLIGSGLLMMKKSEVSFFRIAALCTVSYLLALSVLYADDIPYFFPAMRIYLIFVIFDAAVVNECLYPLGKSFPASVLIFNVAMFAVLSLLILLAPEDDYSLFGKDSLFVLACFIFLPYLIPSAFHTAVKTRRSLDIDKGFSKISRS